LVLAGESTCRPRAVVDFPLKEVVNEVDRKLVAFCTAVSNTPTLYVGVFKGCAQRGGPFGGRVGRR
jgi:hypothetical protein